MAHRGSQIHGADKNTVQPADPDNLSNIFCCLRRLHCRHHHKLFVGILEIMISIHPVSPCPGTWGNPPDPLKRIFAGSDCLFCLLPRADIGDQNPVKSCIQHPLDGYRIIPRSPGKGGHIELGDRLQLGDQRQNISRPMFHVNHQKIKSSLSQNFRCNRASRLQPGSHGSLALF